jgi:two-component system response regulator QseB
MRILIVEDDALLGDGLSGGLRALGFAVDWFRDGDAADQALTHAPYEAIVLDLSLPGGDGMQWLARWRRRGDTTPVLILTARDALDSRVAGLDSGADDYLVKPLAIAELAARLRALTRRARGRPEPVWRHGALEYDPAAKRVTWRGEPVELTSRELALLEVLLANPRRVLSKQQLFEKLYAWDRSIESNAIEVYVHHLRRKIDPAIVRTVRGVGYALGAPDEGKG